MQSIELDKNSCSLDNRIEYSILLFYLNIINNLKININFNFYIQTIDYNLTNKKQLNIGYSFETQ